MPPTAAVQYVRKPYVDPASKDPNFNFPLDGYDLSTISDETLIDLFKTAPVLHSFEGTRIVRLSRTLLLKGDVGTRPCEAAISKLISTKTSIPVPRVHRVLDIETKDVFFGCKCLIVMDFIEGRSVEECWNDLAEEQCEDIIAQVAVMINTLQSVDVPQEPGPPGCKSCLCKGIWFSDIGAGPFGNINEMEAWFNRKLEICQHFKQAPETTPSFQFDKLVLTHQDIALRNLILGSDGKAWLIDWGDAGIYPVGFEAAALIMRKHEAPNFTDGVLGKIEQHHQLTQQLQSIMYGLTTGQYI